jgi:homopolymeric O-antigen transport system permease protein
MNGPVETPMLPALTQQKPSIVIEARRGLFDLDLVSLWHHRDLLYFLVWRDVKIRYKQTIIGAAWAILQPLLTLIVFSLIFGRVAKIPSDNLPYPVFMLSALLPWNLFASSLARGGDSVVNNAGLLSKVYFPRLILPIAAILSPLLDFAMAFVVLIVLMIWYGIVPNIGVVTLPLFVGLAMLTALGVGMVLAAMNARYRDVGYAVPFLVQLWMFVSPVTYPVSMIPERWRFVYSLNPMAGVVEGFRWALLSKQSPDFGVIAISAATVVVLLLSGAVWGSAAACEHNEQHFHCG